MNIKEETRDAILYYKTLGYTPKIIAKQLHLDEKLIFNIMMRSEIKRIFKTEA